MNIYIVIWTNAGILRLFDSAQRPVQRIKNCKAKNALMGNNIPKRFDPSILRSFDPSILRSGRSGCSVRSTHDFHPSILRLRSGRSGHGEKNKGTDQYKSGKQCN
jgi:hypothetical protein